MAARAFGTAASGARRVKASPVRKFADPNPKRQRGAPRYLADASGWDGDGPRIQRIKNRMPKSRHAVANNVLSSA